MGYGFSRRRALLTRGEIARRQTSAWLTWALSREQGELPRIPVRPVRRGGFSHLSGTVFGRIVCWRWWSETLEKLPLRG